MKKNNKADTIDFVELLALNPDEISEEFDAYVEMALEIKWGKRKATPAQFAAACEFAFRSHQVVNDLIANHYDPNILLRTHKTNPNKRAFVITFFDVHLGEKAFAENPYRIDAQPLLVYNIQEAVRRTFHVFNEGINRMKSIGIDKFDELIIAIGGDNVDGDGSVYPGQIHSLDADINTQKLVFSETMIKIVASAAKLMKKVNGVVNVVGVIGNHGRSKFNLNADQIKGNADWQIYEFMKSQLTVLKTETNKYNNVTLSYSSSSENKGFTSKGWNFLLTHIMPQKLQAPSAQKKAQGLHDIYDADVILTGHYHETAYFRAGKSTVIRVGCLPGPNEYSDTLGIYSPGGEQLCLVIHPEYKIEQIIPISFQGVDKNGL